MIPNIDARGTNRYRQVGDIRENKARNREITTGTLPPRQQGLHGAWAGTRQRRKGQGGESRDQR